MTTPSMTRLIPANIIRNVRKEFRIRFLKNFAVDTTMRPQDELSPLDEVARRESLLLIDAAIRGQGMSHPRHLIK